MLWNFFLGVRLLWSWRGIHGEVFNRNYFTWRSLSDCINPEENFKKNCKSGFCFFDWFSYTSNVIFRAPIHNFYLDIFIAKYSFYKRKIIQVKELYFLTYPVFIFSCFINAVRLHSMIQYLHITTAWWKKN